MGVRKKDSKRSDMKDRIIKRQSEEIDSLKLKIEQLNLDSDKKDELIMSVESFRNEMDEILKDIDDKRDKYQNLVDELFEMRKAMDEEVFNGRWKLVRWLIK